MTCSAFKRFLSEVDFFDDFDLAAKKIVNCSCEENTTPSVVAFGNAHSLNLLCDNDDFMEDLMSSDILLRDGFGIYLLCLMNGLNAKCNLNGTDFIPYFIENYCLNKNIVIYGTECVYIEKCLPVFADFGCCVVKYIDGFQDDKVYIEDFIANNPDIVILAMGMPKQERIAKLIKESGSSNAIVFCGGAIIDFMSGRFSRAPLWIRKLNCEWFYRLLCEPKRLFCRYVIGNTIFIFRALYQSAFHRIK